MSKRAWAGVLAAVFVLFGCAADRGFPGGKSSLACRGASCQIDVVVTGTPPHATITVPDEVLVDKNSHDIRLVWHLRDAPRYEFRDDSIQFYQGSARDQFTNPGTGGGGSEYHTTDRNTDQVRYKYLIKVYERATGNATTLDPFVWNGK